MLFEPPVENRIPEVRTKLLSWDNVAKTFVEHIAALLDVPTPETRNSDNPFYIASYEPVLLLAVEVNQISVTKGIRIRAILPEWPGKTELIQALKSNTHVEPKPREVEWVFPLPCPVINQHILLNSNLYMPAFKLMDVPVTFIPGKNALVITSYKPLYIAPVRLSQKPRAQYYYAQLGGSRQTRTPLLTLAFADQVKQVTLLKGDTDYVIRELDKGLGQVEHSRCVFVDPRTAYYLTLAVLFLMLNSTKRNPAVLQELRQFLATCYVVDRYQVTSKQFKLASSSKFVGFWCVFDKPDMSRLLALLCPITVTSERNSVTITPEQVLSWVESYDGITAESTMDFQRQLASALGLDLEECRVVHLVQTDLIDVTNLSPQQLWDQLFEVAGQTKIGLQLTADAPHLLAIFDPLLRSVGQTLADQPSICAYLGVAGYLCPSKTTLGLIKQYAKIVKYVLRVSCREYGWMDFVSLMNALIREDELLERVPTMEGYTNLNTKVVRLVYPALVQVINQAFSLINRYLRTGKPPSQHISRISSLVMTDSILLVSESYSIRNPIAETALAYRVSFPWPEDVRTAAMRALHPSALGIYDPVLTPESSKTGLTNWIVCSPKAIQVSDITLSELYGTSSRR